MEMKENSQKKVLLSVLGVAILVVAVIGISFAAYTTTFKSTANTVTTGTVMVSYNEPSQAINVTNAMPMADADGIAHIGLEKNALPLIAMLSRFNGEVYVDSNGATLAVTSGIFLIIIVFFYVLLFPYIKERFLGMSTAHKNSYLKLYGVKGMAEVKTFKFTHGKGPNNEKESYLTIEFDDVNGKTVTTHLSSYLYSESQEQYIDILYDEKNPNNVVYMRK